jgi:glycosyltransferase involved in cell wall biosynthesis
VKLVDPRTPPQVLYAAADIMLHTSAWEASPLVILEAMSYKLPVVAYDVGGVPEQVRAGRTGYLVAPCDVEMLCECVLTLARKPQLREQMGLAGVGRIKTQFSHGAMLDRIARVYMTIAGKSAAEAPVERHAPSRSWESDPGLVRGVA